MISISLSLSTVRSTDTSHKIETNYYDVAREERKVNFYTLIKVSFRFLVNFMDALIPILNKLQDILNTVGSKTIHYHKLLLFIRRRLFISIVLIDLECW
jgi:hypothetical protein